MLTAFVARVMAAIYTFTAVITQITATVEAMIAFVAV
jgi:hypothetical protein